MRFQFDTDLNQWKANALKRNPDFQENLIELKSYRTGRKGKIGLFSDADAVSTIGFNTWKNVLMRQSAYDGDGRLVSRAVLEDLTHEAGIPLQQLFSETDLVS